MSRNNINRISYDFNINKYVAEYNYLFSRGEWFWERKIILIDTNDVNQLKDLRILKFHYIISDYYDGLLLVRKFWSDS